jgi:hypothetical protein
LKKADTQKKGLEAILARPDAIARLKTFERPIAAQLVQSHHAMAGGDIGVSHLERVILFPLVRRTQK